MKDKKNYVGFGLILLGIALAVAGIVLLKTTDSPQGIMVVLPYIMIGIGCGIFGHGAGGFVSRQTEKKHPQLRKEIEIETKDERNIAIANRAKAKAYDIMLYLFAALMLVFALMRVELAAVLLLVALYLLVVGVQIFYLSKYYKEM